jgi:hypothetical protein
MVPPCRQEKWERNERHSRSDRDTGVLTSAAHKFHGRAARRTDPTRDYRNSRRTCRSRSSHRAVTGKFSRTVEQVDCTHRASVRRATQAQARSENQSPSALMQVSPCMGMVSSRSMGQGSLIPCIRQKKHRQVVRTTDSVVTFCLRNVLNQSDTDEAAPADYATADPAVAGYPARRITSIVTF